MIPIAGRKIRTRKDVESVVRPEIDWLKECFFVLAIDRHRVLRMLKRLDDGTGLRFEVSIDISRIPDIVKKAGADIAIVVHNHPMSDFARPSGQDISMTRKCAALCKRNGVILFDHVIIAKKDSMSFREDGLMDL